MHETITGKWECQGILGFLEDIPIWRETGEPSKSNFPINSVTEIIRDHLQFQLHTHIEKKVRNYHEISELQWFHLYSARSCLNKMENQFMTHHQLLLNVIMTAWALKVLNFKVFLVLGMFSSIIWVLSVSVTNSHPRLLTEAVLVIQWDSPVDNKQLSCLSLICQRHYCLVLGKWFV